MKATIMPGLEYGTDRPCLIGRIEYRRDAREYVALTFCYTDDDSPWHFTWVGQKSENGGDASRLPEGVFPSPEMLAALAVAFSEKDSLPKTPGAGKVEAAGIEPASHSLPNSAISREEVCMCDADDVDTGEHVGWIACPESCCERPDHAHAQEAS